MNQIDVLIEDNLKTMRAAPVLEYEAVLSIGSYQIKMMHVMALSSREDYVRGQYEERMITVTMLPSQYAKLMLYGHADMTMKVTTVTPASQSRSAKTYRAIPATLRDPTMENNSSQRVVQDQDATTVSVAHFQLMDPAAYDIRLRQVGANFLKTKTIDVIKLIFGKTKLSDKYNQSEAVGALQIDTDAVATIPSVVVIPDGTNLITLPQFLQKEYGVYSQGIACFLKNRCWYVFAPYSRKKSTYDVRRLVVINVPGDRYRKLNASYKVDGKTVTVMATGQSLHTDNTDADAMIGGTGTRQTDVTKLIHAPGAVDGTSLPKMNPQQYMREYQGYEYNKAYVNAPMADKPHTANTAVQASALAARNGCYMEVVWERGVSEVLLPGMPVQFLTQDGTKIKQMEGTLVGAEMLSTLQTPGLVDPSHQAQIKLTMFLRDK